MNGGRQSKRDFVKLFDDDVAPVPDSHRVCSEQVNAIWTPDFGAVWMPFAGKGDGRLSASQGSMLLRYEKKKKLCLHRSKRLWIFLEEL